MLARDADGGSSQHRWWQQVAANYSDAITEGLTRQAQLPATFGIHQKIIVLLKSLMSCRRASTVVSVDFESFKIRDLCTSTHGTAIERLRKPRSKSIEGFSLFMASTTEPHL